MNKAFVCGTKQVTKPFSKDIIFADTQPEHFAGRWCFSIQQCISKTCTHVHSLGSIYSLAKASHCSCGPQAGYFIKLWWIGLGSQHMIDLTGASLNTIAVQTGRRRGDSNARYTLLWDVLQSWFFVRERFRENTPHTSWNLSNNFPAHIGVKSQQ